MYKFEVGIRDLATVGFLAQTFGGNHALFRLGTTDFEFSNKGVTITKRVLKQNQYDWNYCGDEFKGTTNVSPKQLEAAIKKSGKWTKDTYKFWKNNCHDFMLFCYNYVTGKNETKLLLCKHEKNYDIKKRMYLFSVGWYEAIYDLFH